MIVFRPTSALPRTLLARDLEVLATTLSKRLRQKRVQSVGVRFVSLNVIQALNRQYRGKNRPTDVLSFEASPLPASSVGRGEEQELGDLVICAAYAQHEARRRKLEPREEYMRLLAHGVLHLSGFDHATEDEELEMFRIQEACVDETLAQV